MSGSGWRRTHIVLRLALLQGVEMPGLGSEALPEARFVLLVCL